VSQHKLVYQDANGVRRTKVWDDEEPDKFHVFTEQDVEEILDGVARDREIMLNTGTNKYIGKVPVTVAERAVHQQWDENDWRKWWNGHGPEDLPNGRNFRVWRPGAWL
jgi:hypothetical protein